MWEKIFIVIFAYFSHKTSNPMKKNTQKYIFHVKFPAEFNPAGRIGLNSEENPENCKNALFIEKFIAQKINFQIMRKDSESHVL